jgi:DNA-directed RNA polymerase subunit beta'
LVDVAQDVIIHENDCKDKAGTYIYREDSDRIGQSFAMRVIGRYITEDVADPKTGEVIAEKGNIVLKEQGLQIEKAGIDKVKIRTLVTCKSPRGVCQKCYGTDLGRGDLVQMGQAVGIVAAQAIGEPGTQLTMRTFHIGGVAGSDITQGLPRVEEIFEARPPKGESIISEIDGKVIGIEHGDKAIIIRVETQDKNKTVEEYQITAGSTLKVAEGDLIGKGTKLSEGNIDLRKLYKTMGWENVYRYIVREIQEIYAAQGEGINDKHIEVIVRQMFSRVLVEESGATTMIGGEIVERDEFDELNRASKAKGAEQATGEKLLLGITKVALSTESFLSAASFQETARVLINAAVAGKEDRLRGLKENVIIGKLIPAGTGYREQK